MKQRASRSPLPPVSPGGAGAAPAGTPQGVLLAVPTVASLRDAELVLPPEGEGRAAEQEGRHLSLVPGGAAPGA